MPALDKDALTILVQSKGAKKGSITRLSSKLILCCSADPFNDSENLDALSTYVSLAETLIHQVVEFQEQIQLMHQRDETVNDDALGVLATSHDDELEPIRLLVTKCKRLIDAARIGPASEALPSVTDSTR